MPNYSFSAHPLLLGFDQIDRILERMTESSRDNYPPFNIEQLSQHKFRISVAVAGFASENLGVTVEDRQLVIRGGLGVDRPERVFLHQGISTRRFQRSFVLAEGMEIKSAHLKSGLLTINLERRHPEKTVETIKIQCVD